MESAVNAGETLATVKPDVDVDSASVVAVSAVSSMAGVRGDAAVAAAVRAPAMAAPKAVR